MSYQQPCLYETCRYRHAFVTQKSIISNSWDTNDEAHSAPDFRCFSYARPGIAIDLVGNTVIIWPTKQNRHMQTAKHTTINLVPLHTPVTFADILKEMERESRKRGTKEITMAAVYSAFYNVLMSNRPTLSKAQFADMENKARKHFRRNHQPYVWAFIITLLMSVIAVMLVNDDPVRFVKVLSFCTVISGVMLIFLIHNVRKSRRDTKEFLEGMSIHRRNLSVHGNEG